MKVEVSAAGSQVHSFLFSAKRTTHTEKPLYVIDELCGILLVFAKLSLCASEAHPHI